MYRSYEHDSVEASLSDPFFLAHVSRYYYAASKIQGREAVLDVACGKGYGSAVLALRAGSVLGVDLNEESLRIARETYVRANLAFEAHDVTRAERLGAAGRKFDHIIAFEVIEHLAPELTDPFLKGLKTCLNPNGRLWLSTPNHAVVIASGVEVPDFHINNFTARAFRKKVLEHFPNSMFLGQYRRQGGLRDLAFRWDRWNLRHRLGPIKRQLLRSPEASPAGPQAPAWKPERMPPEVSEYEFEEEVFPQAGLILSISLGT